MKIIIPILLIAAFILVFKYKNSINTETKVVIRNQLINEQIIDYNFLDCMYDDSYFPKFLVDKCKVVLIDLCHEIENGKPETLEELYLLTHYSTNELNGLEDEFFENGSEIETVARECFGQEFEFISKAYGFDADVEELIATRRW